VLARTRRGVIAGRVRETLRRSWLLSCCCCVCCTLSRHLLCDLTGPIRSDRSIALDGELSARCTVVSVRTHTVRCKAGLAGIVDCSKGMLHEAGRQRSRWEAQHRSLSLKDGALPLQGAGGSHLGCASIAGQVVEHGTRGLWQYAREAIISLVACGCDRGG